MILLREIQERDLDALERFAQIPGFINLTNDKEVLREKISALEQSFRDQLKNKFEGKYHFCCRGSRDSSRSRHLHDCRPAWDDRIPAFLF